MKRRILLVFVVFALGFFVLILAFTQIRLDALQKPGKAETFVATQIKRILIARDSRSGIPPAPKDLPASIEEGGTLFGTDCSMCHGADGHTPTDNGRWMYPRAADLTSPSVQHYTDRELFWIVKNGIRLTGMPGFGKVESDEHIWNLVIYLRTLPGRKPENNGASQ